MTEDAVRQTTNLKRLCAGQPCWSSAEGGKFGATPEPRTPRGMTDMILYASRGLRKTSRIQAAHEGVNCSSHRYVIDRRCTDWSAIITYGLCTTSDEIVIRISISESRSTPVFPRTKTLKRASRTFEYNACACVPDCFHRSTCVHLSVRIGAAISVPGWSSYLHIAGASRTTHTNESGLMTATTALKNIVQRIKYYRPGGGYGSVIWLLRHKKTLLNCITIRLLNYLPRG